jgi:hypothetical protein
MQTRKLVPLALVLLLGERGDVFAAVLPGLAAGPAGHRPHADVRLRRQLLRRPGARLPLHLPGDGDPRLPGRHRPLPHDRQQVRLLPRALAARDSWTHFCQVGGTVVVAPPATAEPLSPSCLIVAGPLYGQCTTRKKTSQVGTGRTTPLRPAFQALPRNLNSLP